MSQETVNEITTGILHVETATDLRDKFGLVVREALLMDARPPASPSEGGLPDMIQASITTGEEVIHAVNQHGMSNSTQAALRRAAYAPLSLLAGALLRCQEVCFLDAELSIPRRTCQEFNAFLWRD